MMITGQGNGQGGREHGQKCDQLPGQRSIADPGGARARGPGLGDRARGDPPGGPLGAWRSWRRSTAARSRRCSRSASTRWSRCPTPTTRARRWRSSSSSASSTSSSPRPPTTPTWSWPAACRRRRKASSAAPRAACIQIQKAVDPPGERPAGLRGSTVDLARRLGKEQVLPLPVAARDLRRAARGLAGRHRRLLRHHLREDRPRRWASSGPVPTEDHPGTPRLFEGGRFFHPDGKARFMVTEWRRERRSGGRGLPGLPDHRAAW